VLGSSGHREQTTSDAGRETETIELRLATGGRDLWPAIEAAQYARLMLPPEVASEAESRVVADFTNAFANCTERWEMTPPQSRAVVFELLESRLRSLGDLGLRVHWASLERGLRLPGGEVRPIPMAVIQVSRKPAPSIRVAIAGRLDVNDLDETTT
jgi:hypothetical protein